MNSWVQQIHSTWGIYLSSEGKRAENLSALLKNRLGECEWDVFLMNVSMLV